MNKQRLAILIVAGIGMIATFLPWVKIPLHGTINGTKGDGWITFALFAIPLILSLLNDKTKRIEGGWLCAVVIPAIFSVVIGIWKIAEFNSIMSDLGDNPFAKSFGVISIEIGLYLVILSGLVLSAVAFLIKDKSE
jgi:hypothetical protein